MAAKASRAVPHITMTPGLEAAIAAIPEAFNGDNPANPQDVRERLGRVARSFEDPAFFFADDAADETKAIETLIKLATLYLEHIRAGNFNDRKD